MNVKPQIVVDIWQDISGRVNTIIILTPNALEEIVTPLERDAVHMCMVVIN